MGLYLLVGGKISELLKENVICTERGGYLRIAAHFYNNDEQLHETMKLPFEQFQANFSGMTTREQLFSESNEGLVLQR